MGNANPRILVAFVGVAMLTGCGTRPAAAIAAPAAEISPTVPPPASEGGIESDALVVPLLHSELAFPLSGNVETLHVEVGATIPAGQPITSLHAPELEFAVAAAEAALRSAQVNAELQRYSNRVLNAAGKFIYQSGPPELRRVTEARVSQAEAELAIAQSRLAQATIASPYPATVITIHATAGEWLSASSPAVTVADLRGFRIETTDLSELDIPSIRVGAPVSIYVEALSRTLGGEVTSISPLAEQRGGETVFKVTVAPDEVPVGLRWGMSATVTFEAR